MYDYIARAVRSADSKHFVMLDPLRHHRLVSSWSREGELVKTVRPVLVIRAPDGRRVLAIERDEIVAKESAWTH